MIKYIANDVFKKSHNVLFRKYYHYYCLYFSRINQVNASIHLKSRIKKALTENQNQVQ
jgi:hypothetical protein